MTTDQERALRNTLHNLYVDEQHLAEALAPSDIAVLDGEAFVVTKMCDDGYSLFVTTYLNPETGMREPTLVKATQASRWTRETATRLAGEFRAEKATFRAEHWVVAYGVQLDQVEDAIETLEALLEN